jgi:hypothetical protein
LGGARFDFPERREGVMEGTFDGIRPSGLDHLTVADAEAVRD